MVKIIKEELSFEESLKKKIEFICDSEYVDNNGLIKYLSEDVKSINYKIIITHDNKSKELEFTTIIK